MLCTFPKRITLGDKGQVGFVLRLDPIRASRGTGKKTLDLASEDLALSLGLFLVAGL